MAVCHLCCRLNRLTRIIDTAGKCFDLCQPEITLEANPSSVDREKMSGGGEKARVTKAFFGVQSANDRELGFWAGFMTFLRQKSAVETAAHVGFRHHLMRYHARGKRVRPLKAFWDSIESLGTPC